MRLLKLSVILAVVCIAAAIIGAGLAVAPEMPNQ